MTGKNPLLVESAKTKLTPWKNFMILGKRVEEQEQEAFIKSLSLNSKVSSVKSLKGSVPQFPHVYDRLGNS